MTGAGRPVRPRGRRVAAALFACLLAACSPPKVTFDAHPAMWLAEDGDTRIYLLGTMHALPESTDWDRGKVAEAVAAADELVMELSPEELAAAGEEFERLAPRRAPLPMDERLTPAALAQYHALEAGGPDFRADALDDWAVMVLMGQRVAQKAALSSDNGVEARLTEDFRAAGKPIGGLETARSQLMLFETLDPATQRALLAKAAEGASDAVADVRALTDAWSRGDVAALEKVINEDVDAVPAAREAIITGRNRVWSAWVKRRMAQPGTLLVAVGAGHLVGADGVPAMLAAEGVKVRRVQ
ncbi:TraB/GumN family protein [Sphingopyxis sp. GW247-27LB]|uniref:TraB/GumN family protein n=1 Tax=Sphingopyxis sp. GW247-27LB TaxID=2012632 RepID=UPI0020D14452|nr:TraB/GumN family protein [Sphingopyxis sp. GW247-27LB]